MHGADPAPFASSELLDMVEKARENGREIPPSMLARIQEIQLRSALYHPVEIEWGDEIWAGVLRGDEAAYGNAVVARRGKHVIMLEWRGPALDEPEKLLAFAQPHLDRLAALEPGESWVEEWQESFDMIYEEDG